MSATNIALSLAIIAADKASKPLHDVTGNIDKMSAAVNNASTSMGRMKNRTDGVVKGIDRMRTAALGLSGTLGKISQGFGKIENAAERVVVAGAKIGLAFAPLIQASRAAISLETSLTQMGIAVAQKGQSPADIRKMSRERLSGIRELGKGTNYSDRQIADMQTTLLKAGISDSDVTGKGGATYALSRLAMISGADQGFLAESMAGIASQYGLKGSQFGEFANSLAKYESAAAGQMTMESLMQSFTMAGATASSLGMTADSTAKSMAVLAPLGARSGSSLNMFLSQITQDKNAKDKKGRTWSTQDFMSVDENGNFDIEKTVAKLREKTGSLGKTERNAIFGSLFGEEGARAANTFVTSSSGFDEIGRAAQSAATLEEKVRIKQESAGAGLDRLNAGLENASAAIMATLLPAINSVAGVGADGLSGISDFAKKHPLITGAGVGVFALAALSPLLAGTFGSLSKGLGKFGKSGGLVKGIAEGKAIEAATGVTPVYVTNFSEMSGGAGGAGTPGLPGVPPVPGNGGAWKKMLPVLSRAGAKMLPVLSVTGTTAGVGLMAFGAERAASKATNMVSEGRYKNLEEAAWDMTFGGGKRGRAFVEANQKFYENFNIPSLNEQTSVNVTVVADMDKVPAKVRSLEISRRRAQAGANRYHRGGDGGYGGGGY